MRVLAAATSLAIAAATLALGAATNVVLVGPAHAQQNSVDPLQLKWAAEQEEKQRIEREYNAMMRDTQRGNAPQAKSDPWAKVRQPVQNSKDKQ